MHYSVFLAFNYIPNCILLNNVNLRYEEIDRPVQDSEMEEVREGRDLAPFLVLCMVRVKKKCWYLSVSLSTP